MDTATIAPDLHGSLVVAVDDSDCSEQALRFAVELARDLGRPVHAVLVWNFVMGPRPEQEPGTPPSVEAWQRHAEQRLDALVQAVAGVDVRRHALHGNTVPTLLAISQVAGHLIVGSRGRGGFAGLLLGSTSDQLVRHARCPVTVVRSQTHEE